LPLAAPGAVIPSDAAPGRVVVPGYEILGVLGRGGMGVVYQVRQVALNRVVALKMILTGAHAAPEVRQRFRREAEAVARLQHPNIVQIHEVGEADGHPFFSLEFCPGGSLADRLNGTPLPAREAARLVETLARAVHAAHDAGIVHRDLKPANVLLGDGDTPKVTDFGLAKQLDRAADQTASGAIVGTPSYMAPEQAGGRNRELGPWTDVYALGAVLYELLTGRPPFRAESPAETLLLVLTEEPVPPSRLRPNLPRDLESVCLQCLRREPARRYPTAAALADDLRRFLDGRPVAARPAGAWERGWRWCRRNPLAAGLAAAVAAALLAGTGTATYFAVRADQQRASAEAEHRRARRNLYLARIGLAQNAWREGEIGRMVELLDEEQPQADPEGGWPFEWYYLRRLCQGEIRKVPWHSRRGEAVALSPDGSRLASAGLSGVRVLDGRTGREILNRDGPGGVPRRLAFSPDGTRLLGIHAWSHEVKLWDVGTGEVILSLPAQADAAFSPDGKRIATAGLGPAQGAVKVRDADTGQELLTLGGVAGRVTGVAFSPDGRHVAAAQDDQTVRVWDTGGGAEVLTLRHTGSVVPSVFYSPDGLRLAAVGADGTVLVWDAATGRQVVTLKGDLYPAEPRLRFNPDGRRLAGVCREGAVRVWDLQTGEEVLRLQGHTGAVFDLAFSADGTRLTTAGADSTVRLWDVRGSVQGPLTFLSRQRGGVRDAPRRGGGASNALAFSPDGRCLAADGGHEVAVWDVQTGQQVLTLGGRGIWLNALAYSPDGRRLAAGGGVAAAPGKGNWAGGPVQVWDARSGAELLFLPGHPTLVHGLAYSRDGARLASASEDGTVKVRDAETGREIHAFQASAGPVFRLAFSPDGNRLATAGNDESVHVWDVQTGRELVSLSGHTGQVGTWAFSPDGSRVAAARWEGDWAGKVARVWDLRTGEEVLSLKGHLGSVRGLAFSPDGTRLAGAYSSPVPGGEVRLWDARTGHEILALSCPPGVWSLAFSPDGKRLAGASADGRVWVWNGSAPRAEDEANRRQELPVR
jgi:WD40 repeat protein